MRLQASSTGHFNWLFLPGGPGIGSDSLRELVAAVDPPGKSWLVDLPGDGSNVSAPGAPVDPYSLWPQVVVEAAQVVDNAVYVGHSTGGEYLLSTPDLAGQLVGLVLISTAPDASWMPMFGEMTANNPLRGAEIANARYEAEPTVENLRAAAVESAPWNFGSDAVAAGTELLSRMPYNPDAVRWSAEHFDRDYELRWWPTTLPTLIVSGADDRVVTQSLWQPRRFRSANVIWRVIADAGHFPWIEKPAAVRDAFAELTHRIKR